MTLDQQIADLNSANTNLTLAVLETKATTATSMVAAESEANRAQAERQKLTTELQQAQTARDEAVAALVQAESVKTGDEAYVVPAVVKLLTGYTDVVDTAISDDIWAKHAHRWGAPKKVLVVAEKDRVVLHDLTKPGLPVWRSAAASAINAYIAGWRAGIDTARTTLLASNISGVAISSGMVLVGSQNDGVNASTGSLFMYDFGIGRGWRIGKTNYESAVTDRPFDQPGSDSGYWRIVADFKLVDRNVNCIAARIADDAPTHPVSGLPMPTIAVATDGGVSVLAPTDSGSWGVVNITSTGPDADHSKVRWIDFNDHGELVISHQSGWEAQYSYIVVGAVPESDVSVYSMSAPGFRRYNAFKNDAVPQGFPSVGPTSKYGDVNHIVSGSEMIMARMTAGEGVSHIHENPSEKSGGMVAFQSEEYCTPWMVGDVHCALLCDGEEGVVAGSELADNGPFDNGLAGWREVGGSGHAAIVGGALEITATADWSEGVSRTYSVEMGKTFVLSVAHRRGTSTMSRVQVTGATGTVNWANNSSDETVDSVGFVATTEFVTVTLYSTAGTAHFDSVSLNAAVLDRSGRRNHARIHGTPSRSKPAGSDIAVWSGIGGTDQIEIANSKDWFPHDKDWHFSFLYNGASTLLISQYGEDSVWNTYDRPGLAVRVTGSDNKFLHVRFGDQTGNSGASQINNMDFNPYVDQPAAISVVKRGSDAAVYVNGRKIGSDSGGWDLDKGLAYDNLRIVNVPIARWVACLTYSETAPSEDQICDMHRDMLAKLKNPSMLTAPVSAIAHDSVRDERYVIGSDRKLHRLARRGTTIEQTIDIPADVGSVESLSVRDGEIVVGGSAGVWVSQPGNNLRVPSVCQTTEVQAFSLGNGDNSKTAFWLPLGWKPKQLFLDGLKQKQGANSWLPIFDGYKYGVRFSEAPGNVAVDCKAVCTKN